MKLKKIILLISFLIPLFFPLSVQADYIYGGPTSVSQILLDKLVKNPVTGLFVDNLGPSDSKFGPESEVIFKIVVKNTGSQDLSGVTVRDVLPNYLDFVSGPANSNWNKDNKELTFNIGDLKASEVKEYEIKAKVVAKKDLPTDRSVICLSNWAEAKNGNLSDADTTGFCLSNVSFLPPTGPNPVMVGWVFLMGFGGFWLIRKSKFA